MNDDKNYAWVKDPLKVQDWPKSSIIWLHFEGGGVKMAEEQDGVITFSSTNSLKEQQNGEQSLQNNF